MKFTYIFANNQALYDTNEPRNSICRDRQIPGYVSRYHCVVELTAPKYIVILSQKDGSKLQGVTTGYAVSQKADITVSFTFHTCSCRKSRYLLLWRMPPHFSIPASSLHAKSSQISLTTHG